MAERGAPGAADETEFRAQLSAVLPHLRAFARGLCGNANLADDLVQETAIKAWTNRDRFQIGTNMRAWTFTILRNTYLNELRANKRLVAYDADLAEHTVVEPASQEARLHLNDLEAALQRLQPERREALLLVGASNFTYQAAAEICGVATGTMKSRVARARNELAQFFGDAEPDAPPATRPAQAAAKTNTIA